jgi:hypothetical protein
MEGVKRGKAEEREWVAAAIMDGPAILNILIICKISIEVEGMAASKFRRQ